MEMPAGRAVSGERHGREVRRIMKLRAEKRERRNEEKTFLLLSVMASDPSDCQ